MVILSFLKEVVLALLSLEAVKKAAMKLVPNLASRIIWVRRVTSASDPAYQSFEDLYMFCANKVKDYDKWEEPAFVADWIRNEETDFLYVARNPFQVLAFLYFTYFRDYPYVFIAYAGAQIKKRDTKARKLAASRKALSRVLEKGLGEFLATRPDVKGIIYEVKLSTVAQHFNRIAQTLSNKKGMYLVPLKVDIPYVVPKMPGRGMRDDEYVTGLYYLPLKPLNLERPGFLPKREVVELLNFAYFTYEDTCQGEIDPDEYRSYLLGIKERIVRDLDDWVPITAGRAMKKLHVDAKPSDSGQTR